MPCNLADQAIIELESALVAGDSAAAWIGGWVKQAAQRSMSKKRLTVGLVIKL